MLHSGFRRRFGALSGPARPRQRRSAVPAAARGLDPQAIAGPELALGLGRQRLAVEQVAPGAPVARRRRAPRVAWRRRSVISVNRIGASASISRTIPSPPRRRPAAAAAPAHRELADADRKLALERLDRGVQRVRHRHVDRARAVGVGAGALAAAERLVVGEAARRPGSGCSSSPGPARGPRWRRRARRSRGRRPGSRSRRCRRRPPPASGRSGASPRGALTSIGRWAPAEGGASGSVSTRTAKNAADLVTESGQLRLPSTWASLPAKSSRSALARDRRPDPQAGVGFALRTGLEGRPRRS